MSYCMKEGHIFNDDSGREIAFFRDGRLVFNAGMAGPHKKKVLAWLQAQSAKDDMDLTPISAEPSAGPPWSAEFGVDTPGFKEWCQNLGQNDILALIRKMERGKK